MNLVFPNNKIWPVDDNQYADARIDIELREAINRDLEEFLDLITEKAFGSIMLSDIRYSVIGVSGDLIQIKVTGNVSDIIGECKVSEPDSNTFLVIADRNAIDTTANANLNVTKVAIEHWNSPRYGGDVELTSSRVYECEIDDRRCTTGQVILTITAESGHIEDYMDVLAEVNTLPGTDTAVPCLHVAFDASNLAFSVYQNGLGKLMLRPETDVKLLPTQLPTGETVFIVQ